MDNSNIKQEGQRNNQVRTKKTTKKNYVDFTKRLVVGIIAFLILLILGTLLLNKALRFENTELIKYNENGNLDYKVYLFENEFYEEPYLGKDMLYVASLIDKIHLDFNYKYNIEDQENLDFNYRIVGKLSITNSEGTKSYFEKTYDLLNSKSISMKNSKEQIIKETIDIDYPYYNSLANNFKSTYGLDTASNLNVYMVIDKKSNQDSNFNLNSNSMMNIKIPLSEKAINIELDSNDINRTSSILKERKMSLSNIIMLILGVVLIIASLVVAITIIRILSKILNKKTAYDKYIQKILKEYDRLIAEVSTMISLEKKEIIKITKFTELLDIHDNLQLPIMYYSVTDHQKANFFINHDKTVYLLTVKSIDEKTYKIED